MLHEKGIFFSSSGIITKWVCCLKSQSQQEEAEQGLAPRQVWFRLSAFVHFSRATLAMLLLLWGLLPSISTFHGPHTSPPTETWPRQPYVRWSCHSSFSTSSNFERRLSFSLQKFKGLQKCYAMDTSLRDGFDAE